MVTNHQPVDQCVVEVDAHSEVNHRHLHYRDGLIYHINLNIGEQEIITVYYALLING